MRLTLILFDLILSRDCLTNHDCAYGGLCLNGKCRCDFQCQSYFTFPLKTLADLDHSVVCARWVFKFYSLNNFLNLSVPESLHSVGNRLRKIFIFRLLRNCERLRGLSMLWRLSNCPPAVFISYIIRTIKPDENQAWRKTLKFYKKKYRR